MRLRRAILLTVAYADVFEYPLTVEEIRRRLIGERATSEQVRSALGSLPAGALAMKDHYVVLPGREHLVALRLAREEAARELWTHAHRYAAWLAHVPFVRMIAVSGSLAVNNAGRGGDVDVFCVTDANRLWLARLFITPLSKLTRLLPVYLCPNYVLASDALTVSECNLFVAHEIAQAVPIAGGRLYALFRRRNEWIYGLLPNGLPAPSHAPDIRKPLPASIVERILRGRRGDRLDALCFRLFVTFYRTRARRRNWNWHRLEPAYRRNRYAVPEGGYAGVVARRLRDRLHDMDIGEADISRLFPNRRSGMPVHDWEALFGREYGHA